MPIFALADCNNFYCSCERVFAPRLTGVPVIVLSNNDGCAIARSAEAKAFGIKMGDPEFKIRDLIQRHDIQVFSSNYVLYGDMSARVMHTLADFGDLEVYSIDEAFIDLAPVATDRSEYCQTMRRMVKQVTGIPTSIGVASTKTLAKLANRVAKRTPAFGGVFDLTAAGLRVDDVLDSVDVEDVWGIGRAHGGRLRAAGITTARQLRDADASWVKQTMTVVGLRTVLELRGESCIELEETAPTRKGVTSSRSFAAPIDEFEALAEAVATFVSRAAAKLRHQSLAAGHVSVFVETNRFRPADAQYANSCSMRLAVQTDDTRELIGQATALLRRLYRKGYRYKKAGVMLTELVDRGRIQVGLFDTVDRDRSQKLMSVLDAINGTMGRDTVRFASTRLNSTVRTWTTKRDRLSPRFTTCWDELPVASCN